MIIPKIQIVLCLKTYLPSQKADCAVEVLHELQMRTNLISLSHERKLCCYFNGASTLTLLFIELHDRVRVYLHRKFKETLFSACVL